MIASQTLPALFGTALGHFGPERFVAFWPLAGTVHVKTIRFAFSSEVALPTIEILKALAPQSAEAALSPGMAGVFDSKANIIFAIERTDAELWLKSQEPRQPPSESLVALAEKISAEIDINQAQRNVRSQIEAIRMLEQLAAEEHKPTRPSRKPGR